MIVDNEFLVADNVTVRASDPGYSSSVDLTVSPDVGAVDGWVAVVIVNDYAIGSSTSTTINVVTSSAADLTTTPLVIGTAVIAAADLELRDATGLGPVVAPIVIRINPKHERQTPPAGVTERYIGLQFDHATTPTTMNVTAYFTNAYQGDAFHTQQTPGMKVL